MSVEANTATARRIIDDAFNHGRMEVYDEICAPDVVTHDPAQPDDIRGTDAHKARVGLYRTAMPDLYVDIQGAFGENDMVAMRWTATGTNKGEFMGVPPTGRSMKISGNSICRFDADGRVVEVWDNWDNAGFMLQLGLQAAMEGAQA